MVREGFGCGGVESDASDGGAGFGGPPVVDDIGVGGAVFLQKSLVHPDDTGLAAFPSQEQRAQLPELAFLAAGGKELVVRVVAFYGAKGGRGGGERVDGVLGADAPEGAGVGRADGFAFEEHGRGAGEEGRV